MVNVENQRLKKLMKFKSDVLNSLMASKLSFAKETVGNIVYENILFEGRKIAHFKYENNVIKFEIGDDKCAAVKQESIEEINSLPQS